MASVDSIFIDASWCYHKIDHSLLKFRIEEIPLILIKASIYSIGPLELIDIFTWMRNTFKYLSNQKMKKKSKILNERYCTVIIPSIIKQCLIL